MFTLHISGTPVVLSKFFSAADRESVLAAVRAHSPRRVVFIDTPATVELVATVEALKADGVEIHVRDHHDAPERSNPREIAIADAAGKVRELAGGNAVISNRKANPACSSLIEVGQFVGEGTVIVADPDPDGLTASMKALGVVYDGIDTDAAVLDGAHSEQTAERLTPIALLLVKGMVTLPPFNPERPAVSEEAKGKLFAEFVAAATGDDTALKSLGRKVETYEAGVREAEAIAATATQPISGVVMVDAVGKPRHDLATLSAKMEAQPGCRVTVIRKDNGPIAGKHGGVQISLAVAKAHQAAVNLQDLLPSGFTSSPEAGIISNTTFLLHVSEKVWNETVLPALTTKFGG